MDARVSLVTLGVADLARSLAFYRDGLGWRPAAASVGDVVFFQAGGVVLALYPRRLLAEEARQGVTAPADAFGGFALAHNVRTRDEVDRTLDEVASAGGRILKPAEDASWGGRSGYFADLDGHAWEVAWNPSFTMEADGTIRLS